MKRGHIILIAGGALLAIGIAIATVWGYFFASTFMQENTIISQTTIAPSRSIEVTTDVDAIEKSLSLAVGLDQQSNDDVKLRGMITNPNGKIISTDEFDDSFFTSIQPDATGRYTATIANLGSEPVRVTGTFGHVPFVGVQGKPDVNAMVGGQGLGTIIAGGGLAAAGILVLIIGAIITIVDGRKTGGSTTTTEGGITYRKE
jgi:hypothetical protein